MINVVHNNIEQMIAKESKGKKTIEFADLYLPDVGAKINIWKNYGYI